MIDDQKVQRRWILGLSRSIVPATLIFAPIIALGLRDVVPGAGTLATVMMVGGFAWLVSQQ